VGEPALRVLPTREELVDRYSRFAAGRPGAECQVAADWAIGIIREHASPADEALRSQFARLCSELNEKASRIERAERERDALRQELAEVTGQAEQVEGDLALLRRERDEARAQLEEANAANDRDFALVQEECRELRSKLAARPEPVVVDEALASKVCDVLYAQGLYWTRDGVFDALRSVLGDKVSVAGPQSQPTTEAALAIVSRAGYHILSAESLERHQKLLDERDKLRAELQAAQSDLQLARKAFRRCDVARVRVSEKYEALRALVAVHDSDKDLPGSINMVWYGNRVHDGARALLKPATPEAQSSHGPLGDVWVNASPADALRPNDRHAQRPASEMPRPASLAPLTARVERLEAALRHFLTACGKNGPHDAANEALSMLDAGKQEVG
jgi:predicted nuclease with TOPRIM domain